MLFKMEQIESIKSNEIKRISLFLLKQGYTISFFGKAWSQLNSNWIYFNTVLNINSLINQFDNERILRIHEYTDLKNGHERGLIDPTTGEGVMGLIS